MDLGGGWFDSPEIMKEIEYMVEVNRKLRDKLHKSESDVLIVVDEECIYYFKTSNHLKNGFMEGFISEVQLSGMLIDTYRLKDLEHIDLSCYKMIIFAYTFKIGTDLWNNIMAKIPDTTTLMFNYAAGIYNESFDFDNTEKITGFKIADYDENEGNYDFPQIEISPAKEMRILMQSVSGKIKVAERIRTGGGLNVLNTKAYLCSDIIREIAEKAGCHIYTPPKCTVYGDNRLLGVFPKEDIQGSIMLKKSGSYTEVLTGEQFKDVAEIPIDIKGKGARVFVRK